MTAKLPDSWNTDDENPVRAARELHKLIGPDAAFISYGRKWWIIRYLDPADRFRVNVMMQTRELDPWQRKSEVLAVGDHFGEVLWQLRGGRARAMVGQGMRPIHDARTGEWVGFADPQGKEITTTKGTDDGNS